MCIFYPFYILFFSIILEYTIVFFANIWVFISNYALSLYIGCVIFNENTYKNLPKKENITRNDVWRITAIWIAFPNQTFLLYFFQWINARYLHESSLMQDFHVRFFPRVLSRVNGKFRSFACKGEKQ